MGKAYNLLVSSIGTPFLPVIILYTQKWQGRQIGWDVIRAEEEKAQEGNTINVDMNRRGRKLPGKGKAPAHCCLP